MSIGILHVDSQNLHTEDACVIRKHYTIMTANVNPNNFQGTEGTDGPSFRPADGCKNIHQSFFPKEENANKHRQSTKKQIKKTILQDYHRCPSPQSL